MGAVNASVGATKRPITVADDERDANVGKVRFLTRSACECLSHIG